MLKFKKVNLFRSLRVSARVCWLVLVGAFVLSDLGGSCQVIAQQGPPVQAASPDNQPSPATANPVGSQSQPTEASGQAGSKPSNPTQLAPSQQEPPAVSTPSNEDGSADSKPLSDVTRDAVEKEWESIESSSGIDDAVKETLRPVDHRLVRGSGTAV